MNTMWHRYGPVYKSTSGENERRRVLVCARSVHFVAIIVENIVIPHVPVPGSLEHESDMIHQEPTENAAPPFRVGKFCRYLRSPFHRAWT